MWLILMFDEDKYDGITANLGKNGTNLIIVSGGLAYMNLCIAFSQYWYRQDKKSWAPLVHSGVF